MKLQNQVCNMEQAEKLKQLGVAQASLFSWVKHKQTAFPEPAVFFCGEIQAHKEEIGDGCFGIIVVASAFNVSELGAMLGPFINYPQRSDRNDYWYIFLDKYEQFKTEAEVRAATLIYRLEKGAITAAEVNHLLQNA